MRGHEPDSGAGLRPGRAVHRPADGCGAPLLHPAQGRSPLPAADRIRAGHGPGAAPGARRGCSRVVPQALRPGLRLLAEGRRWLPVALCYMLCGFCRGLKMLETTLTQLERLLDDLLQQNSKQQETIARLERELLQLREENDNLQLSNLEQEEQLATTLERLKGMLERSGAGSQSTPA